jgi:hypothetical protein
MVAPSGRVNRRPTGLEGPEGPAAYVTKRADADTEAGAAAAGMVSEPLMTRSSPGSTITSKTTAALRDYLNHGAESADGLLVGDTARRSSYE